MRYLITIFGLFLITLTSAQKIKKSDVILTSRLIENGGLLVIQTRYSIGEAIYPEQTIFIEKHDSSLIAKVIIDTSSYFVNHKSFKWNDTTIIISYRHFNDLIDLIDLEKALFKKGLQPTFNCDGNQGQIIHNQTSVFFIYDKGITFDKVKAENVNISNYFNKEFSKITKYKAINISGGFLSMKDEILNLGLIFKRCKTYWWTN